jgi:hypothetical protein
MKPRKRRFYFHAWHDVVLLNAALADEGIMLASGRWKHAWKTIEAAVNSEGVPVAAHSIRARLQLVVDSYRVDLSTRNLDPAEMSAKQKLLGEYCHKLDDMKNESEGHDNHSLEPTHEKDELEHPESGGANAAELQSIGRSPGSEEPTQGNLAACVASKQLPAIFRPPRQHSRLRPLHEFSELQAVCRAATLSLQELRKLRECLHQIARTSERVALKAPSRQAPKHRRRFHLLHRPSHQQTLIQRILRSLSGRDRSWSSKPFCSASCPSRMSADESSARTSARDSAPNRSCRSRQSTCKGERWTSMTRR